VKHSPFGMALGASSSFPGAAAAQSSTASPGRDRYDGKMPQKHEVEVPGPDHGLAVRVARLKSIRMCAWQRPTATRPSGQMRRAWVFTASDRRAQQAATSSSLRFCFTRRTHPWPGAINWLAPAGCSAQSRDRTGSRKMRPSPGPSRQGIITQTTASWPIAVSARISTITNALPQGDTSRRNRSRWSTPGFGKTLPRASLRRRTRQCNRGADEAAVPVAN
jgi:hypothetical protein